MCEEKDAEERADAGLYVGHEEIQSLKGPDRPARTDAWIVSDHLRHLANASSNRTATNGSEWEAIAPAETA
jgi:hypothetical protein